MKHPQACQVLHLCSSSVFRDTRVCICTAMSLWCLSKTFPCIFVSGISSDSTGLWVSETLAVAMAMPHCNTDPACCSVDARTVSVAGETCWMLISPSTVCPSSDQRNTLDLHYTLSLSIAPRTPISTGRNILFWSLHEVQSKLVWSDAMLMLVDKCPWMFRFSKIKILHLHLKSGILCKQII